MRTIALPLAALAVLSLASASSCRKSGATPECTAALVPLLDDIPWAAMASGWASGPDDIVMVGGRDRVPAVIRFDGRRWSKMNVLVENVPSPQLLWWVHGISATSIWAVGENGGAIHWDGMLWKNSATATDATLSGIWGLDDKDVWAVGGYPGLSKERGIILHWDGVTWLTTRYHLNGDGSLMDSDIVGDCTERAVTVLSSRALVLKNNLFKVWGAAPDDAWAVGTGGLILRYDGKRWHCGGVDPAVSFITVWGRGPDDVFAVGSVLAGGPAPTEDAAVYHFDGTAWTQWPTPQGTPGLLGVWADEQQVVVVGHQGTALRTGRDGGPWTRIQTGGMAGSLHHVFAVDGVLLASGGNLLDPSIDRRGFVLTECPVRLTGGAVDNTDGGLDAVVPPPKGKGETPSGEKCATDDDCMPGHGCIWVYGGPICTIRCAGDPDCYGGPYGNNPCCTRSSLASGDLVCAPAHHCPPDW